MHSHATGTALATGWWECDLERGVVWWDEATCAIYGCPGPRELALEEAAAFIHPEDRERSLQAATAAVSDAGPDRYQIVKRVLRGDEVRWVRVFGRVDRRSGGTAPGQRLVGFIEDVTDAVRGDPSSVPESDLRAELEARAKALAISEGRLRRIVDSDMIGVLFWRMGGQVTFANDAFLDLLGYDRSELEGGEIDWKAITPPGWEEVDARAVEQLLDRGVSEPFEKEYLHRDGRPIPVLLSAASFEGEREQGITLVVDLTARKAAEKALRDEALLRRIALDAAGLGTWHLDLETSRARFDERAREIFGYGDRSEMSMEESAEVIHPEDRARWKEAVARALRPGGSDRCEIRKRIVTPAGETRHVYVNARVQEVGGRRIRLVGTVRDETERVEAEEALRASEERFRGTFEHAAVGMVHVDPRGRILRVNRRFAEMIGRSRQELLTRRVVDLTVPGDVDEDRRAMRRLAEGELERYAKDRRYVRADGSTRWGHVTVSLVRKAGGEPDYFIAVVEDIEKRKEAEASLRQAERHLRGVLDSLFAFVGVTDPGGTLLEVNRAALEAAQLAPEEVIGRPFAGTYWWSYDDEVREQLQRAIEKAAAGTVSRYDVLVRLGPEHYEPIDFMIAPMRDEDGAITHLVASAMVITDRVEVETALRESETRLRAALSAARMGTWDVNLTSGLVDRSDSTDRIFGLDPGKDGIRTADDYFALVHPDDIEGVMGAIERSIASGGEHRVEYRIVRPDGEERYLSSRGHIVKDERGVARRLIGALVDVTARHRAEEARRETEERFRTLADRIPQLAWMADADGSVFWYNSRWFEYTGTDLEDVRGWGWTRVYHPDHVERVVSRMREAWKKGESWEDTFPLRSRSGEYRWFLSRAVPVRNAEGEITRWLGTHTDVTEQREAAAEREELLEEAEVANRTKAEFMAVMSHELRTPLNAIVGYSDLLDAGVPDPLPEGALDQVRRIRLAAKHQRQLIDDILTFMRLDAGREAAEPEPFDVRDLVDEIVAVLSPASQRNGLQLVVDTSKAPERVVSDPRKLRQILLNLLGNAIKFTEAGEVRLTVRYGGAHRLVFEVSDTGPGIPAEDREHLFEPFWQGDRSHTRKAEGTGLGLSIAERFTRMLDGRIEVESELGSGTLFTVAIPLRPPSPGRATEA